MELDNICCPSCKHSLDHLSDHLEENHCLYCGALYTIRDGIIDFTPQNNFYWGEIEQYRMKIINNQAEQLGDWYESICQNLTDRPSLIKYILDPARLGWLFHCYEENNNQACLDVGSGWGMLSFGLSRFYKNVYSIDGVIERLHFQAIRAKIDGVKNISFLRSGFLQLPIQDKTLDLVVLNGVLEWVGLSDSDQRPDILQKQFINEISRVIKSNGKIYLGIENRFGLLYFLGHKDHSGLPFTSLVPRSLANRIVRNSLRKKVKDGSDIHVFDNAESRYRTYTYSLWGYKKLLNHAGFNNIVPYWAWQSYSYPRMSGPMDGTSIRYIASNLNNLVNDKWRRLFIRLILVIPDFALSILIKLFSPHFLIIASRKQTSSNSLQDTALINYQYKNHFVRLTLGTNPKIKTTYLLLDKKGNVSKSIRIMEKNHTLDPSNLFMFKEEKGIAGRLIRPYNKHEIVLAAKWLADFQLKSKKNEWTYQQLIDEIKTLAGTVGVLPGYENLKLLIKEFETKYVDIIKSIKLSVVKEHGDFTLPNIIITSKNSLNVIDWEFSKEIGNPLMDIGSFYLSLLRRVSNNNTFNKPFTKNKPLVWFMEELYPQIHIPFSITPTYYLLRVIQRVQEQNEESIGLKNSLAEWNMLLSCTLKYSLSKDDF